MRHAKSAVVCLVFVGISSCTGSTNPETATLFDNINNLNSGEYDRQIANNEAQAQAILRNNAAAEQRISGLERQQAANSRQISGLNSQIESAMNAAASARARVGNDAGKAAQLRRLERQIDSVAAEVRTGAADPGIASAELRRIRSAISAL